MHRMVSLNSRGRGYFPKMGVSRRNGHRSIFDDEMKPMLWELEFSRDQFHRIQGCRLCSRSVRESFLITSDR